MELKLDKCTQITCRFAEHQHCWKLCCTNTFVLQQSLHATQCTPVYLHITYISMNMLKCIRHTS